MRWLRLIPVALLGILAVGYVIVRPTLAQSVEHLDIVEFPAGAIVVALLVWAALGRRRPEPAPPWRRHEQRVRPVPDPALRPYVDALERYVETGESPQAAADVLAKARTTDPHEQERLRATLAEDLSVTASRRKRESRLKKHLEGV